MKPTGPSSRHATVRIKPLFYAFYGETLYFASEVKALFAAGVPARWDAESVYHSVEFGGHQLRTLFDGIVQVPPGYYLIATENHIQLHHIGISIIPGPTVPCLSTPCRLRRRVSRCAGGGGTHPSAGRRSVGCYLSGASTPVRSRLGGAASPVPIRAFTLTFDHADYDEEKESTEMARRPARNSSPSLSGRTIWPTILPMRYHNRDALLNAHGVAKYLLSRAVRDAGYKVVITGEGSDEILGGYAHFRRDMLLYNREGQDRL